MLCGGQRWTPLLEAPDLKARAETLIAITEMTLARENEDFGSSLQ